MDIDYDVLLKIDKFLDKIMGKTTFEYWTEDYQYMRFIAHLQRTLKMYLQGKTPGDYNQIPRWGLSAGRMQFFITDAMEHAMSMPKSTMPHSTVKSAIAYLERNRATASAAEIASMRAKADEWIRARKEEEAANEELIQQRIEELTSEFRT